MELVYFLKEPNSVYQALFAPPTHESLGMRLNYVCSSLVISSCTVLSCQSHPYTTKEMKKYELDYLHGARKTIDKPAKK